MTDDTTSLVRLNKFLALALGFSRRQADDLIAGGKVMIDGEKAALGARFDPAVQVVLVDGKKVATDTAFRYIAFNKPAGYVCSRRAQGDASTIYDLLPSDFRALKPVGRLDKNSSGLILLTNDGDFAHTMTHPSFHKVKQYAVTLDRPLQPLHRQMISDFGVMLEDGKSKFEIARPEVEQQAKSNMQNGEIPLEAYNKRVADDGAAPENVSALADTFLGADRLSGPARSDLRADLSVDKSNDGSGKSNGGEVSGKSKQADDKTDWIPEQVGNDNAEVGNDNAEEGGSNDTHWIITMSEGRNRQIRRTFAALGYEVIELHRIQFGPYQLSDLDSGKFVTISPQ